MPDTWDDEQLSFAEVVRTTEELNALFEDKRHNWRYAGFVSVLVQRREAAQLRVRDHLFGFAAPSGERARDAQSIGRFAIDSIHDYAQIQQQITTFMLSDAFIAIMCAPHDEDTADATSVCHAAMRLMDFYDRFLTFSERARGLAAPSHYNDLLDNLARLVDAALVGFDSFIDEFERRVAEMPQILMDAGGGEVAGEPMVLKIDTDDDLLNTILEQLKTIAEERDDY